jgi:diguanylate cyclase (GGDEF)-like protein
MNKDSLFEDNVTLSRQDLIYYEHALKDAISEFLPYESYSLYFPKPTGDTSSSLKAKYLRDSRELMLPLVLRGAELGYFIARGVDIESPESTGFYLQALASAALEKLLLYKSSITDSLTGLLTREQFLKKVVKELDLIQNCLMPAPGGCKDPGIPTFSGSLGVILVDLDNFQRINDRYGFQFGNSIISRVAAKLRELAPHPVICSRYLDDKFALMLPDGRPRTCADLAERLREAVESIPVTDDVTGDIIKISASVGYANYPQSLSGAHFKTSAYEQSRIIMRKAEKAVSTAKDMGRNQVFAYSDILKKGGKVLEVLPLQRLALSIGHSVDAREGSRFLVWAPEFHSGYQGRITEDERISGSYPTMYKAEVVLIEVQNDVAFAEILHLSDPAWPVVSGDRLTLLEEKNSFFDTQAGPESGKSPQKDMVTGLYSYRDFIGRYSRLRQNEDLFSIAVFRLSGSPGEQGGNFQKFNDALVQKVASRAETFFPENVTGGRYSLNSLIYYFPSTESDNVMGLALRLVRECAEDFSIDLSSGVAGYPFLNFSRSEVLDNCRKALDHAMMLAEPKVAQFDSVSLNISADRLYVDGDIYAAVEEFKAALLADPDNILARNSLGICYAQIGRPEQAARMFEEVLDITPNNIMALYNLGWACHMIGEMDKARCSYEKCLELDPDNVFSLVRLGLLAEHDSDFEKAKEYYLRASVLKGGDSLTMRHLARLAYNAGEADKTREYLHLALNANHNDAASMNLLARLYLDNGEDPQVAEVLARQSSALKPGNNRYWKTLSDALEAQGKIEEAAEVLSRLAG